MHCTSGKLDESSLGDVGKGRRQESTASQDGLSGWAVESCPGSDIFRREARSFTSPRLMSPRIQWGFGS